MKHRLTRGLHKEYNLYKIIKVLIKIMNGKS